MSDITDFEKEKLNVQKLYFLLLENYFENFKYKTNILYASFKNKDFLSFNYEKEKEERVSNLNSTYKDLINSSNNIKYKEILSDIFYEDDIDESFLLLDKKNYNDEMFTLRVIQRKKEQKDDLFRIREKIFIQTYKFDFLTREQKETLSLFVDEFIDKVDDFIDTQEILHADFFKDLDDLHFLEEVEGDDPIIMSNDEEVDKIANSFDNTDIMKIVEKKSDVRFYKDFREFESLNIDYDRLLKKLIKDLEDK